MIQKNNSYTQVYILLANVVRYEGITFTFEQMSTFQLMTLKKYKGRHTKSDWHYSVLLFLFLLSDIDNCSYKLYGDIRASDIQLGCTQCYTTRGLNDSFPNQRVLAGILYYIIILRSKHKFNRLQYSTMTSRRQLNSAEPRSLIGTLTQSTLCVYI